MHKNNRILLVLGFIFFLLLFMPQGLIALPSDPTVESGSASFEQPDPNTLNITADDKAVINFTSFDIALNETVNFFQPTSTSTVLSRITGPNGTSIWGGLNANGILFLVNPRGIYFAQSAQVNAAGLVASTLDISTNNFLAGNYIFEHSSDSPFAQVLNEGSITADNVALIGSSANNSGVIMAQAGTVHLASGDKTTVSFDARGLIQVEVNEETSGQVYDLNGVSVKDAVANSGTIEAAHVVMTAQTAADIFESAVNTTGVVRATGFVQEGGTIKITANKDIKVSGTLEAQNNGTITVESTQGNVSIPLSLTLIGTTALNSLEKDILIQAPIVHSGGSLALYAPLGSIVNTSGTPIRGPDVSLKAQNIDTQVDSPVISVWRNADNLHLTRSSQEDGLITLEGDGLSLVYPVTTALTLKSNNTITTEPGVVLQAKSLKVEANKFGTIENPLYLLADTTYLNRLSGNIDIVYSQVFGSQVLVRGPPDGFGAIIYSASTFLTLEAPNGSISLASNMTLASTSGSVTLKTNKGNIDVFDTISAPEGDVTLWTCGNIDVRYATIISKNGGFIYNPDDTISVSWIGGSGNSWGTGANWSGGNVPNDANYVVTIDLASAAVTTSADYTIGALTVGGTQTCSLTLGGNLTLDTSLGATGNLTIGAGGTLSAGSYTITVPGNWDSSAGTFTYGTSTVVMTGASNNITTASRFKNLTIDTGAIITAQSTFTVETSGNLVISGTLNIAASKQLTALNCNITLNTGGILGGAGTFKQRVNSVAAPRVVVLNGTVSVATYIFDLFNSDGGAPGVPITAANYQGDLTIFTTGNTDINYTYITGGDLTVGGTLTIKTGLTYSNFTVILDNSQENRNITAGALIIGDSGYATQYSQLIAGSGTITINGNVTIYSSDASGANSITAGSSTWYVSGNWTNNDTFTAGTSIVTFNGTSTQSITPNAQAFNNLTIANTSADVSLSGALTVSGTLTINSNATLSLAGQGLTVSITLTNNGTLKLRGSETVTIPGAAPQVIGGTVTYTGDGDSLADTYDLKNWSYNNLTINSTDGATDTFRLPTANITASGNFTLTAGTFTTKDSGTTDRNLSVTGNVTIAGTFTANSSTITVGGNWDSSAGTFTYGTSTVNLTGTGNLKTLGVVYTGVDFYNLNAAAATKTTTLLSYVGVANVLTLSTGTLAGTNFNISLRASTGTPLVDAGATISVGEFLYYPQSAGTITVAGGTNYTGGYYYLWASTSNTTFNINGTITVSDVFQIFGDTGTSNIIINTQNNAITANKLWFGDSVATGSTTLNCGNSAIILNAALTVITNSGSHTLNLENASIITATNWRLSSGTGTITQNPGTSTVTMNGTTDQLIWCNNQSFYNLTINKSSGSAIPQDALTVNGTFNLQSGTFDANSLTNTITGGLATISGGTYQAKTATQTFNGGLTINGGTFTGSTGAVDVNGNLTLSLGTLTAPSGSFTVSGNWSKTGGTFTPGSNTVTFDGAGASILSGSTIFYNLASSTAGKTLSLTRGTTQTITHDFTLTGTAGDPIVLNDTGAGAVPKITLQAGSTQNLDNVTVTNNDASLGLMLVARGTGSTLNGTILNWILSLNGTVYTWTGTVSGDWNNAANWDLGLVPSSTDTVVIPSGTPFAPVLGGSETLTELTIEEGGTISTGGQPLTVTGDVALNGTLNAGSSTITISGDLTGSSTGILEGEDVTLAVSGSVGSLSSPVITSVSGTLTISASQMQDNVSVSVSGSNNYSFSSSIPGFVFVNGSLSPHVGQAAIRSSLEQGESNLYNSMPAMPQSLLTPPPLNLISMLATPMGPAPVAIPITMPQAPVVLPPQSQATTPPVHSFEGIATTSQAQQPESFSGLTTEATVPQDITESFTDILPSAQTLAPFTKETFSGANTQDLLPASIDSMFEGAQGSQALPESITPEVFEGVTSTIRMTTSPISFEELSDSANIKVAFPEGQKVIPTYDLGIPLGAEKPILETKIETGIKGRR
jgi:filamentous hemagglutinin family protein